MAGSASLRVVVVEDDPAMGAMVCAMLEPIASAVQLVRSADKALAWLATEPVDAVMTDFSLEGEMSGLELVRTVHALWPTVRVVVITGWTDQATTQHAHAAGAHAVLGKPFRVTNLLSAMQAAPD